jgi:hypothetical protein
MTTGDIVRERALDLARSETNREQAVSELLTSSGGRRVAAVRARQQLVGGSIASPTSQTRSGPSSSWTSCSRSCRTRREHSSPGRACKTAEIIPTWRMTSWVSSARFRWPGSAYEFITEDGARVGVVHHRSGMRELVLFEREDPDTSHDLVRLSAEESRTLGQGAQQGLIVVT